MSCYRCAEKFRLFKKELGCPNCGFSFCSKCLNCRIKVPKKGDQVLNVCQKCNDLLKSEADQNSKIKDYSPPKNFIKLIEENRSKIETKNQDKDIELRLSKLKNDPKRSLPECSDIEARLNKLQDRNETYNKLSNLPSKQVVNTPEDLISKLTEEVKIDQNYEQFEKRELEKLEERLKNLKNGLNLNQETSNEQNYDQLPKKELNSNDKLINKMLQDAEFSMKRDIDCEQDLWCCLCNDDASIKCSDCDDDLYCKRCFKQTHCSGEYKYHKKSNINFS